MCVFSGVIVREKEKEREREREREKREKRERERWREIESTEGSIINQHFFRNRIKFLFQKPTKKTSKSFFLLCLGWIYSKVKISINFFSVRKKRWRLERS